MDGLGYACAVALAAVFVRAGAAKLARPAATATTFTALGVPAAPIAARAVPVVELLVAVALLGAPRGGAVAALALLGPFTAALARAVAAGVQTPCNCFGAARAEPVSRVDIARNLLLTLLAAVALSAGGPTVPALPAAVLAGGGFAAGAAVLTRLRRPAPS